VGAKIGVTKAGAGTWTLSGANSYTGATTITGGKLILGSSMTTSSSLTVSGSGVVEVAQSGSRVIKTPTVAIAAGARIDLQDNKLITTTPAGTFSGGAYTGIQGEVQRAYDFGRGTSRLDDVDADAGPLVGTTTIGVSTARRSCSSRRRKRAPSPGRP
jgi:autotransporter-associated beta strand protein